MIILHAAIKNRFKIGFCDSHGQKLSFSNSLALQAIRVSKFSINGGSLFIDIEDDVTNVAAKAIQELLAFSAEAGLMAKPPLFFLVISYLDGDENIIRQVKLGCKLVDVNIGDLDYGSPEKIEYCIHLTHGEAQFIFPDGKRFTSATEL